MDINSIDFLTKDYCYQLQKSSRLKVRALTMLISLLAVFIPYFTISYHNSKIKNQINSFEHKLYEMYEEKNEIIELSNSIKNTREALNSLKNIHEKPQYAKNLQTYLNKFEGQIWLKRIQFNYHKNDINKANITGVAIIQDQESMTNMIGDKNIINDNITSSESIIIEGNQAIELRWGDQ